MDIEATTITALAAAQEEVRQAIDHLDGVRADLEATAAGLRLPENEEETDELTGKEEMDAVIRCAVRDHLRPLIVSLRSLLEDAP